MATPCSVTLNRMAGIYQAQGKTRKALNYYKMDLEISLAGEDPLETATTLNCIGNVYTELGNFEEALDKYNQALAIRRAELGDEHPAVAIVMVRLGRVYEDMVDYDKALELYRDALDMQRSTLGENCLEVVSTLYDMGTTLRYKGKAWAAREVYRSALAMRRGLEQDGGAAVREDDDPPVRKIEHSIESVQTKIDNLDMWIQSIIDAENEPEDDADADADADAGRAQGAQEAQGVERHDSIDDEDVHVVAGPLDIDPDDIDEHEML